MGRKRLASGADGGGKNTANMKAAALRRSEDARCPQCNRANATRRTNIMVYGVFLGSVRTCRWCNYRVERTK